MNIAIKNRLIHLGYFYSKGDAIKAREEAEVYYWKDDISKGRK